jgi:RNA polymerase subunit RPABC4/transcription elongation factor Spt4
MAGPRILNENNEELNESSQYCPRCGSTNLEIGAVSKAPDFDEEGWFYTRGYNCKNPKCGHIWGNKIVILDGRQPH